MQDENVFLLHSTVEAPNTFYATLAVDQVEQEM